MSLKNIAIVGASGNIGRGILPTLLESDLNITLLTRTSSAAKFPAGASVVPSDFTLASLKSAFQGQDAVISCIPITALGDQAVLIEAAIAAGVKRFIPSEYGSDSSNPAVIAAVPFFEAKQKYLEYLKTKQDMITWTALITGPFFDWGLAQGFIGFNLATKSALLVDGGETKFTTSTVAQIARSLIAILNHAEQTANKLVFVESFTTTQVQVLGALEKVTGEKWNVSHAQAADIRSEGFKAMAEGDLVGGGVKVITTIVLGKEALEDHRGVEGGIWNDKLGLVMENVEEEVSKVLEFVARVGEK
ncbi:isoflavone reductase [Cadophora sp. MPI-SDFR-AT-0126]|nr:isoflavone reductase [Leotiomycetes sp. MPI-SDFR-AT-0126]